MAILDPLFSILDLANARVLPLSLFEQPAKGAFNALLDWSAGQDPLEKIDVSPKTKDLHFLSNLLGVILLL
jgi:hypothetical protein